MRHVELVQVMNSLKERKGSERELLEGAGKKRIIRELMHRYTLHLRETPAKAGESAMKRPQGSHVNSMKQGGTAIRN